MSAPLIECVEPRAVSGSTSIGASAAASGVARGTSTSSSPMPVRRVALGGEVSISAPLGECVEPLAMVGWTSDAAAAASGAAATAVESSVTGAASSTPTLDSADALNRVVRAFTATGDTSVVFAALDAFAASFFAPYDHLDGAMLPLASYPDELFQ